MNFDTLEEAIIDIDMSRYKKLSMGFMNSLKFDKRFCKHIILTQAKESYKPNHLNNFFNCMRRYYGDLIYIWTSEIQEERFKDTGEAVLHWHIICGFDWGIDFGAEDVLRIQKYWKYGTVRIIPVRRPSVGYLMKYITKSLSDQVETRVRRVGSSAIAGWLRQSWTRLVDAINFFLPKGVTVDMFDDFWWSNGNAYGRSLIGVYSDVPLYEKVMFYHRKYTAWHKVEIYEGEAF